MRYLFILLILLTGSISYAQVDTLVANRQYYFDALTAHGAVWTFTLDLNAACGNTTTTIIDLHTLHVPDQFFIYDPDGNLILETLPVGAHQLMYSIQGYTEFYNQAGQSLFYHYPDWEVMPSDHWWFTSDIEWRKQYSRIILTSNFDYVTLVAAANPNAGSLFYMYMHEPEYAGDGYPVEVHNYYPVCFEDEVELITTHIQSHPCDTIIYDHYILDPYFENLTFDDIYVQIWENAPGNLWLENPGGYEYILWNGVEINLFTLTTQNDTTFVVEGVTDNGCYFIDTVNVFVFYDNVYIPNTFTPNFDGNNDYFTYYTPTLILQEEIWIYHRWGGVVWHSNKARWDGTYNGTPLDPGVFVYVIKLQFPNKTWQSYQGDITLLK